MCHKITGTVQTEKNPNCPCPIVVPSLLSHSCRKEAKIFPVLSTTKNAYKRFHVEILFQFNFHLFSSRAVFSTSATHKQQKILFIMCLIVARSLVDARKRQRDWKLNGVKEDESTSWEGEHIMREYETNFRLMNFYLFDKHRKTPLKFFPSTFFLSSRSFALCHFGLFFFLF